MIRIRSFARVTLLQRWMVLGLGEPRVLNPIYAVVIFSNYSLAFTVSHIVTKSIM